MQVVKQREEDLVRVAVVFKGLARSAILEDLAGVED